MYTYITYRRRQELFHGGVYYIFTAIKIKKGQGELILAVRVHIKNVAVIIMNTNGSARLNI